MRGARPGPRPWRRFLRGAALLLVGLAGALPAGQARADLLMCLRLFGPPPGTGPAEIRVEAKLCVSGAFDTEDCSDRVPYVLPGGPVSAVQLICADYSGMMPDAEFWQDFVPNRRHRAILRHPSPGGAGWQETPLPLTPAESLNDVPEATGRAGTTFQLWPVEGGGLELIARCPPGAAGCS